MSRYSKTMSDTMAEVRAKEKELLEVSPPGFKGTVKAMKKHDEIDNPYALVDEANLPPHLAKFFDKKGNPKPEVAKRMSDAARKKKVVSKDVTPKGYGPNEDIDILHAEAIQENGMVEEVEWKVKLRGLPMFYVPAKSAGQVRTMLRKQIKKPDDIISIERSTQAAKKKDFRGRVSGKDSES